MQRHVGAGKTMKNVMGRNLTSICSPAPVAPPAPATALPPTTKSSLKLKSKVGARTLLLMIDFQRTYRVFFLTGAPLKNLSASR